MQYSPDLLCDPKELEGLDPTKTAHLCIDMQEGCFGDDASRFQTSARRLEVQEVGDRIVRLAPVFNEAGMAMTKYVYHAVKEDLARPHFLIVRPYRDEIFPKPHFSAFINTSLDDLLQEKGIETLILSGGYATCCVAETAKDGLRRDYNVFVLADCVLDYEAEPSIKALRESFTVPSLIKQTRMAFFTSSEAVLRHLQKGLALSSRSQSRASP